MPPAREQNGNGKRDAAAVEAEFDDENDLPEEIIPDYASDTSDEETTNTVGNIPIEWYDDLDHIGYDKDGRKIAKPKQGDALDAFLEQMDSPDAWRSVLNKLEGKKVALSDGELDILKRIFSRSFPESSYDPHEPTVEYFTGLTEIHPVTAVPEPKRRFVPSRHEAAKVMKLVRAIRKGLITPGTKTLTQRPSLYDLWMESDNPKDHPMHIPAPKMPLPDHRESYNPPEEYIPNEEEIKEWESLDPEDRPRNFIPKKYPNLRSVPLHQRFIEERFDRCLDLYLCPRMVKKRINVDPESLIPKLPNRRELEPYPSKLAIVYEGHTARIRAISTDPTGKWLASGEDVLTDSRFYEHRFVDPPLALLRFGRRDGALLGGVDGAVRQSVEDRDTRCGGLVESKRDSLYIGRGDVRPLFLVVGVGLFMGTTLILINPSFHNSETVVATDGLFQSVWATPEPSSTNKWVKPGDAHYKEGRRVVVEHDKTQRYVRVYNLTRQELVRRLLPGVKWISSMDVHPQGDNVIIGSYDKRVCWFDMDLSTKPYKVLRYHAAAVKSVTFHRTYPLFASGCDDGKVNIFHGMVYSNLDQNPLIIPVKSFKAHNVVDSLGERPIWFFDFA
ncbi:Ribosome biogenesis protein 1 [Irineochytrium annulatum]|nr:Ribosome biogenesis protein 1 [Irineochytrium annulatum]